MSDLDYDFKLFFAVWVTQHPELFPLDIPGVHLQIIDYFEDPEWLNNTKVLLLWRGVGKSTLVDLWIAYKLSKNPALRFLIISSSDANAAKSSANILKIIKTHPLCDGLYDEKLKTRETFFFVRGGGANRDPSVRAVGIQSQITGGRADYIVFDDVESPENSGTERNRDRLDKKCSEIQNTLAGSQYGYSLFIGTYHDTDSLYDRQKTKNVSVLRVPLLENIKGDYPFITGDIAWPERYSQRDIEVLLLKPKGEFYSQYLLLPEKLGEAHLDPALLEPNRYRSNLEILQLGGDIKATLKVKGEDRQIFSSSCYWDPALSKGKGDDSVIALVLTDLEGRHYIHRAQKLEGDVDAQVAGARRFALQYHARTVVVEDNGPGAFVAGVLRKALEHTGITAQAYHIPNNATKSKRIIEAIEGPLYRGTLYIHEAVFNGPFLGQMADFNPSNISNQRNDYLDAVAGALGRQPRYILGDIDVGSRQWWEYGSNTTTKDADPFELQDSDSIFAFDDNLF